MTSRALNQTISSSPKSTLNIPSYDREIRTPKSIRSFLDISMLPPPSPPRDLRHELAAKTKLLETADISQLIDFYPHPEPSDPLPELPTFGALEPESAIGDETLKSLINRFQMNRPDISVSTAFDNPEANSFQGIGNLEPTPISSPRVKMIQAIGAKRSQLFTSKLSFSVPSFPASKGLSISNDNRGAVSSHGCRQIHVFDLDNPQFVPLLRASSPMSSKENAWNVSTSNFSRFTDFSLCPVNGDILGALDTKGLLHVWKFQNPSKTSKLELSSDDHMAILPGGALSFHPFDPSTLATCYITGLLKIFDIEKQMVKNSIEEFNKQNVYSISWMPCGTMLGTSGEDRFAKIFDTRFKNSLVATVQAHESSRPFKFEWVDGSGSSDSVMFSTLGFNLTSELQLRLWDSRYLKDTVFESTIERNTPNIGVLLYDVSSKLICCSTRKSSCLKFFKLDCSQTKLIPYPEIELEGSDHLALAFRQPTMDHDLPDLFRIHSEAIENISVFWKKGFDSTFAHEENHALDGIRIFDELQNIRHGDLFRDQIEASDSNNTSDSLASKKKTLIKLIQEDKFSEDELSFMLDTRTSPMRQTLRSSVDLTFRKINELQSAIQKDLSQVKKIQSMRDDAFTILEEIRNQLGVVSLDDPQVIESHHEPKLKSGRLFKNYQANHQVASVMDPEPSSTPIEAFKSLPAQVRKLKQNSLKGNSSQDEIQQFRLSISASFEQNHIAVYLKSCWFDI